MKPLKLLFICGSLEPGKDGVGDYTRRLAAKLIKKGHKVALLAYHDGHLTLDNDSDQFYEGLRIPSLRLASVNPAYLRVKSASKWVTICNPEWISLQYVPFSFQKKGLPWYLDKELSIVGKGRKWHIMFHELWVGMEHEASFKTNILGRLQQYFIRRMLNRLNPKMVHTQSSLYKAKLEQLGCTPKLLPLFSNIPVVHFSNKKEKNYISLVNFGAIQPGAPFSQFTNDLLKYSRDIKKKVRFTFIGNSGNQLEKWVLICEERGFSVNILGQMEPEKISEVLSSSDLGISSTPFFQSEKSGAIAAMLDHQLPVYCVSRAWTPKGSGKAQFPSGVKEYVPNSPKFSIQSIKNRSNSLENITELFSDNLVNS